MLRFQWKYFLLASALLLLEIGIALFMHDRIIRPYGGDFLATIFLYCLARSFVVAPTRRVVAAVLLFSYAVEGLQYINALGYLGWQHIRVARIVFGSHFEWSDLLAYTLGALAVVGLERVFELLQAPKPALTR